MFALTVELLLLLILVAWCTYLIRERYSFWARQGVPFVPGRFPLGNIQHSSHRMVDLYRQLKGKHPFGGIYQFMEPVAMITDPTLLCNVTVRHFRHFYDRGGFANAAHDHLSGNLLNGEGKRWSMIRQGTVSIFSTVRLKANHAEMLQVMDRFRTVLNETLARDGEKIELKHWIARLTTDIAARVLFGIEGNGLLDRDGGLYAQLGRKTFLVPQRWQLFLMTSFRPLAQSLGLRLFSRDLGDLFLQITRDVVAYRKAHPEQYWNDLVDRLLHLNKPDGSGPLLEREIAANMYAFLAASYETTSTVVSCCLYELAKHPVLQERARSCALQAKKKYGSFTFTSLSDMTYIDQCINETLRMYPPGINIVRVVTEDYPVPGTDNVLRKGLHVIVPTYAIHHDPEYYPEPDRFDPERFTAEACASRPPFTFLPFGEGPKICIAHRMGKMEVRLILASLLCSYRFACCHESPVSQSTEHTVIRMADGLMVNVKHV